MKILLVAVLFVVAAQIPSCESKSDFVGFVDEKYILGMEGKPHYVILIGAAEIEVPRDFWRQVEVGDLIKFENGHWVIVKKAVR